jgi:hypothetical protein
MNWLFSVSFVLVLVDAVVVEVGEVEAVPGEVPSLPMAKVSRKSDI